MNRAPSSLDPWWEDHRRTCGGTYTKVKEPEGYGKKGKKEGKKASGNNKPSTAATGNTPVALPKSSAGVGSANGTQHIVYRLITVGPYLRDLDL